MKKVFVLLGVLLIIMLVGCSTKNSESQSEINKDDETVTAESQDSNDSVGQLEESEEELNNTLEQVEDAETELYINMLNSLLNEYDTNYEEFDIKVALSLYEVVKGIAEQDIDVAYDMKESLLEPLSEKQAEVYGLFIDDVIELEESFK
ncbi:hypothetical protein [Virgibacillus pantothenticus]|uniref:Lipoprotein n=1 Tax=Virgibacillus pantothenticus TaxID=1473 RepID=A0A0L0QMC4_VIRPA|nr:hypothetical protein [Virgibacillus pantothenticus]KNE19659.1 hypothetical protein AFK71_14470 [Virgibacillus pantothenticus]MED3736637.1 hypothetical protein [Virgibacillus pantothenticus]QTY14812.1 hypothetical protein KBP50_12815 [Virgibacillus pantothenticus]SIS79452.1 hypothetical protein SAMN05421787_103268 [Virgibacillus pantothenticus]